MKKIFSIILIGITITSIRAQNINDALRFGITDLNGTARYRAMGGAFGALGGDLSSIHNNPAGSSVFNNNQFGITFTNYSTNNDSDYFGTDTNSHHNSFTVNQAGGVFVFNSRNPNATVKKFAFAIDYEDTKNLGNSVFSAGINPTNSVDNYFLSYANGIPLGNITGYDFNQLYYNEQQAYFGYYSYLIDPLVDTNSNTTYTSNISNGGNYYQENYIHSSGYNNKVAFNASAQFSDKLYLGLNLNSHFIDYRQTSSFYESNNNPKNPVGTTVDRVVFTNDLYTYGSGFSFQVGGIFKPTKQTRLGLAYESKTWFDLTDSLNQAITTSGYGLNTVQNNSTYSSVTVNPNLTMIYLPYQLDTPGKITGSFAYIFGNKGLISLDYIAKDYSHMKYQPERDFSTENSIMSNTLTWANEIRIGAEYKINKASLRGGYRWEQSPYKNGNTIGDLMGYSGGLGYNFGMIKLDFAYSYTKRDANQQFFSQGLTDYARINSVNQNATFSVLFEM